MNFSTNLSLNLTDAQDYSEIFLDSAVRTNLVGISLITMLGLAGHLLTLGVYSQKKNRLNSSNIYIMCLTISDLAFLILNFFGKYRDSSGCIRFKNF